MERIPLHHICFRTDFATSSLNQFDLTQILSGTDTVSLYRHLIKILTFFSTYISNISVCLALMALKYKLKAIQHVHDKTAESEKKSSSSCRNFSDDISHAKLSNVSTPSSYYSDYRYLSHGTNGLSFKTQNSFPQSFSIIVSHFFISGCSHENKEKIFRHFVQQNDDPFFARLRSPVSEPRWRKIGSLFSWARPLLEGVIERIRPPFFVLAT